MLARALNDHDANRRVGSDLLDRGHEGFSHGFIKRIERFRAVKCERGNPSKRGVCGDDDGCVRTHEKTSKAVRTVEKCMSTMSVTLWA